MSTAPIINVSNVATSSASVTTAGSAPTSSNESFGQVLSREVNSRNNSAGNAGSSNVNDSQAGTSSTATTGVTGSKTAKTKPGGNASQTDASTNATTNADASSANASAQLFALVTDVQQSTPGSHTSTAGSNASTAISGSLPAGSASSAVNLSLPAQAALETFQTVATAAGNAADSAGGKPLSGAPQVELKMDLKNIKLADSSSSTATDSTAADTSNTLQQLEKQSASTAPVATLSTAALDLSATAEKDVQAGLAALDSNAVKIEQAAQSTPTIVATVNPQQAALNAQTLPVNPGDKLTPQVGSSAWDQAVGQKVVWMVAGGQQNASLTLNPPDLGPMQVVLSVTNSHATVSFTAAQPEVRQALENAIPKLREMLGDAGIQLGQASINSGSAQQQNTASQQGSRNSSLAGNTGNAIEATTSTTSATPTSAGLGLVDTFA